MAEGLYGREAPNSYARAAPDVYSRPGMTDAYVRSTPEAFARVKPDGHIHLAYQRPSSRSRSTQQARAGSSRENSRTRDSKENLHAYKGSTPYYSEPARPSRKEDIYERERKESVSWNAIPPLYARTAGRDEYGRRASIDDFARPMQESAHPASQPSRPIPHVSPQTRRHTEPQPIPRSTENWVREQQTVAAEESEWRRQHQERRHAKPHSHENPYSRVTSPKVANEAAWDDLARAYERDAERWMRDEEALRADARAREKERTLHDQTRRVEARIRARREAERAQVGEDRARRFAEERDGRERVRNTVRTEAAWRAYEAGWKRLAHLKHEDAIGFAGVPWPLERAPARAEDVTPEKVSAFLLSEAHSRDVPRKERIRRAQLRWHPDRFQRLVPHIVSADRQEVQEAAGTVARCLNDLMAAEGVRGTEAHRRATR